MKEIEKADLAKAYGGSWYFVAGCGGDLAEWVKGYEDLLEKEGIGKPSAWHVATGEEINRFAFPGGFDPEWNECFQPGLACLLFPLDGLDAGRLAMFKLRTTDRWFDDTIDNMRRRSSGIDWFIEAPSVN